MSTFDEQYEHMRALCHKVAEMEGAIDKTASPDFHRLAEAPWIGGLPYLYDKALLLDLVLKYEVDVCNYTGVVSIASGYTDRPPLAQISFGDAEGFPLAVVECIVAAAAADDEM